MSNNIYAFPFTPTDLSGQIAPTQSGMTLRDYFAGQVLQSLLVGFDKGWSNTQYAEESYRMADAMLAEREGEK